MNKLIGVILVAFSVLIEVDVYGTFLGLHFFEVIRCTLYVVRY